MAGDPELLEEIQISSSRGAPWPLLSRLPVALAEAQGSPVAYRDLLKLAHEELKTRFLAEEPIEPLVHARAAFIDVMLCEIWRSQFADAPDWALIAVGGYGRGELHPCSDVDLMVLVPSPLDAAGRARIEKLIAFLWDIGLEVGHSVRTVEECAQEAAADVGVMTTLLEARALAGNVPLVECMRAALGLEHV
jgi:[protein-PII] uridylyltransferase